MAIAVCVTCLWEEKTGTTVDTSASKTEWAEKVGVSEAAIRRHLKHPPTNGEGPTKPAGESNSENPDGSADYVRFSRKAWTRADFEDFLRQSGTDPDTVTFTHGWTSAPNGGFWNKLNNVRVKDAVRVADMAPEWPVIQPAAPARFDYLAPDSWSTRENGLSLSLKVADSQVGFRALPDGAYEEFHDWKAMRVFVEVCRQEQPDSIVILGDALDLPSQGKYIQEAGFARTTQMAIDELHKWLVMLRTACPDAKIVLIEGNHDKRMQVFMELNALAAFGLRRANVPDEWPVMSLQNLLRLEEIRVEYQDAYPSAVYWDDDRTRNIHGTRANSKGSTMAQYATDLPHINTWAGHTHRTEIIFKSVMGARGEAIESYFANPGCVCKTDGTVPSVHGSLHADGTSAKVVEDWQQGFGSLLYGNGEAWPQVWRIRDGKAYYDGRIIEA